MNWVFEAYSNVYNTAMMQDGARPARAAVAKSGNSLTRLFGFLARQG